MKLFSIVASLNSGTISSYQKFQTQLYRTKTDRIRFSGKRPASKSLFTRISALGDPNTSVVPALDQWIEEGNSATKFEIQEVINKLVNFGRVKHALEVSLWMNNKRGIHVSSYDIGVRLKLIHKKFGLEQVENYFYKIPENMRMYQNYLALLNCYTIEKSVDKAESIMQKARELGYASKPVWYNLMMNLYQHLGHREKLCDLLIEMEDKGIPYDSFTYSICLNACAMASDAEGMDRVVRMMESERVGVVSWETWIIAAKCYLKIGSIDEALVIMKKLEKRLKRNSEEKIMVFFFLIRLYAEAGKKNEIFRIWKLFKKKEKVINKVYISMMRALMKFDDIEGMEKIYEDWELSASWFDFRVPNFLIDAYCTDGHLEKAEALITKVKLKGGDPLVTTWCHLAGGYLKKNQVPEAIRSLRKAISICPFKFMSQKDSLITCLEYLEKGDCMEKAEELIKSIRMKGISRDIASNEFDSLSKDVEVLSCGEDQGFERILETEDELVDDLEFGSNVTAKQM